MVARWKISCFRARERKGRQAGRAAAVDLADGRRRFVFIHRSAERREQSGLVTGWKNNRVHERNKSRRPGEAGAKEEKGRGIEKSGERDFASHFIATDEIAGRQGDQDRR